MSLLQKALLLKQFKQFHPDVTIKTVIIRSGWAWLLHGTENKVKFIQEENFLCDKTSKNNHIWYC